MTPPPLPPLPPPVPPAGFVPTDADVDLLSRLIQICRPYPAAVREAIALRNRLKSLVPLSADSPPPPPQPPDEPPPN